MIIGRATLDDVMLQISRYYSDSTTLWRYISINTKMESINIVQRVLMVCCVSIFLINDA